MSKDPAVAFYTSDFIASTMTMDDEQVGKYIRLLCLQHIKETSGKFLNEKDMKKICLTYDVEIYDKFIKDGEIYYNKRMRSETIKRQKFVESRSQNRKKAPSVEHMKNICQTHDTSYEKHMGNGYGNGNGNGKGNGKGKDLSASPERLKFNEAYPKNGSCVAPEIDTILAKCIAKDGEQVVIDGAAAYRRYCELKYENQFVSYIRQAKNFLQDFDYLTDWDAKLAADKKQAQKDGRAEVDDSDLSEILNWRPENES